MQHWTGGLQPVGSEVMVAYRLRNGTEGTARAGSLRWAHGGFCEGTHAHALTRQHDIVAWKPLVEEATGLRVKVKKLVPEAKLPEYATDGSGCFDLFAVNGGTLGSMIRGGDIVQLATGLAFEIPVGYVMLIFSRSGHGFKDQIRLSNCVGIIDSDYRGEVMVQLKLDNRGPVQKDFNPGDRIAQAMIVPRPRAHFDLTDELSDTERGEGGFGSTGA